MDSAIQKIHLAPVYAYKKIINSIDFEDLKNAILNNPKTVAKEDKMAGNTHMTGDIDFPHQNPSGIKLKKEILNYAKEALDKDYRISELWAVALQPGQATGYHRHSSNTHMFPQEYWSGVIYISAPDGSANLCLHAEACNTMEFVERIEPQQGLCVLFNSYVAHQTERHEGTDLRICVGFNLEPISPNKRIIPDTSHWKNNFD